MLAPLRRRAAIVSLAFAALVPACGAKTGLRGAEREFDASARNDGASVDADALDRDVSSDDVPALAAIAPSGGTSSALCNDDTRSTVFLLHEGNTIVQFTPPDRFRDLGTLTCSPRVRDARAISLAVDRTAHGLVLYDDGELFRFTADNLGNCPEPGCTNPCEPVSAWTPRTDSFRLFSMAFVSNGDVPESLFVASRTGPSMLGGITMPTFALQPLASLPSFVTAPSLTGTGGNQLFAFFARSQGGASLAAIDVANGALFARRDLQSVALGSASAVAVFGGEFYLFVDRNGDSEVLRVHPSTGAVADLGGLTGRIVSAAVSTCAPQ